MTDLAIETHDYGHRFGKHWAVQGLDLQVPRGSVFGLLGPNGAGKSTTLRMLMGLLSPSAGSARVLGLDPARQDLDVRKRVGYVAEEHGFYEWMTVEEHIRLVSAYHPGWDHALTGELRDEFGLDGRSPVRELSKGMRVRLALLLALGFDPEVLVLDEPTGGLDPVARRTFIETILGRYQESGKTILLSSHLLNDFSGLLDHVGFMREGRLELALPLEELSARVKRVRLTFPDGVPANLSLPGADRMVTNGREVVVFFHEFHAEETRRAVERVDATQALVEELTLEDIFVEVLS